MKKKILYFALVPFLLLLQNNQLYAAMKRQRSDDTNSPVQPTKKNKFSCSYCGLSCEHLSKKVIHERTHTGEKPFQCLQCFQSFARAYTLKQHHTKVHIHKRDFQCSQCSASYARQGDLTNHITKNHTEKKLSPCIYFPITLPQQNYPTNHIEKNPITTTAKNVPQQKIAHLPTHHNDVFDEYITWLNESNY